MTEAKSARAFVEAVLFFHKADCLIPNVFGSHQVMRAFQADEPENGAVYPWRLVSRSKAGCVLLHYALSARTAKFEDQKS